GARHGPPALGADAFVVHGQAGEVIAAARAARAAGEPQRTKSGERRGGCGHSVHVRRYESSRGGVPAPAQPLSIHRQMAWLASMATPHGTNTNRNRRTAWCCA